MLVPTSRFSVSQELPIDIDTAWAFFSRPENLALITPPELGFEVVSPVPERMYAGLLVLYRVHPLLGVPLAWTTEITHLREPHFFVDEQRRGPYSFWHHQHLLEPVPGGVRMTDLVHFALPCGWAGRLVAGRLVRRRLEAIFAYRRQALEARFGRYDPGEGDR